MNWLDKLNVLRAVLAANVFGTQTPVACHFSVTNRCPWKCSYCGFRLIDKAELSTEQAIRLINELADAGTRRLHLTGGEPALRADIGLLIAEAKKRSMFVTMASTGYRFGEIWDSIRDTDLFFLSFDGPAQIHDATRGNGSYAVVTRAMDLLEEKKQPFWTTTVVTASNINHIDFILDTAKTRGFVANFHLLYFTDTQTHLQGSFHQGKPGNDLAVDNQTYRKAIAYLLERKKSDLSQTIGSSAAYFEALLDWGNLAQVYRSTPSKRYRCWAGTLYCYVNANGDVYPCGDAMGRTRGVSALDSGFADALQKISPLPCKSCIVACFNELNLMFSLSPGAILNWIQRI